MSSIVSHKSIRIPQSLLVQQLILSNFKYVNYDLLFYDLCYPLVITASVLMIILVTSKLKNEYLRQLLIKKSSAATCCRLAFIMPVLEVLSGCLSCSLEFSGFQCSQGSGFQTLTMFCHLLPHPLCLREVAPVPVCVAASLSVER